MITIHVRAPSQDYPVYCGRGAIRRLGSLVAGLGDVSGMFVVSSPRVWRCCGRLFASRGLGGEIKRSILFEDAETAKRLATVEQICRKLAHAGADRNSVLIAVGGGVVGDIAGFVAATYLRGVRLVHVPTTLIAQVDSSIGGKTGVNLPEGKNLVGAFYQPSFVVADLVVLRSLPVRQYRSGLYEVIKYGVVGDERLFNFLERDLKKLWRKEPRALAWVVPRCIRAKAEIVRRDEREAGLRQVLNLGHTLGHALEAAMSYRRFIHGEAVGWGMILAAYLSVATNRLAPQEAMRIVRLVRRLGPLPSLRGMQAGRLLHIMQSDKKARGGRILWVLPRRIGRVEWGNEVPDALVKKAFEEISRLFSAAGGQG